MKEKMTVLCKNSLQMNTFALLVQTASNFKSSVYISNSPKHANAKSLLGVMSLGIAEGVSLELEADGVDATEALDALVRILQGEV